MLKVIMRKPNECIILKKLKDINPFKLQQTSKLEC